MAKSVVALSDKTVVALSVAKGWVPVPRNRDPPLRCAQGDTVRSSLATLRAATLRRLRATTFLAGADRQLRAKAAEALRRIGACRARRGELSECKATARRYGHGPHRLLVPQRKSALTTHPPPPPYPRTD